MPRGENVCHGDTTPEGKARERDRNAPIIWRGRTSARYEGAEVALARAHISEIERDIFINNVCARRGGES